MMKLKKSLLIATILLSIGQAVNASSEIETLITMLHENGMISNEQYGRLQAELSERQVQNNQEKVALQKQLAEVTKPSDVEVSVKGGVTVKTRDGAFTTKFGGRIMADAAAFNNDNIGDGTEIRRARLLLHGKMYHDWAYKIEYDFATAHEKGLADGFVEYQGLDAMSFRAGNMKDPFSLQFQMNANHNLFMERSLTNALNTGRHIGVMALTNRKDWTASLGLFGDNIQTVGGQNDEGWGVGSRVTYAPINSKGSLVHLAVSANYRDSGEAATLRFKQQPESEESGINVVDTGNMQNVDSHAKYGLELAVVSGPLSVQSEYATVSVSRNTNSSLDFNSWYVQTGYFFTGESRQYKFGKFGNIIPKSSLGEDGIGAWELGLRYSTVNLNDHDVQGGEADSITLGLNWFATPTVRFSANYINMLDIQNGPLDSEDLDVVQFRSQWAF